MHTLAFFLFLSFLLSVSPAPCRLILSTLSLTSEATFGGCCLIIRLCLSENITFLDSFDFSFVSQLEERFSVICYFVTRNSGGMTPGARKVKVRTQRLLRCSFSLDCEVLLFLYCFKRLPFGTTARDDTTCQTRLLGHCLVAFDAPFAPFSSFSSAAVAPDKRALARDSHSIVILSLPFFLNQTDFCLRHQHQQQQQKRLQLQSVAEHCVYGHCHCWSPPPVSQSQSSKLQMSPCTPEQQQCDGRGGGLGSEWTSPAKSAAVLID